MKIIPLKGIPEQRVFYHNVAELEINAHGVIPRRVPAEWRQRFPPQTALHALMPAGIEIRFRAAVSAISLEVDVLDPANGELLVALYHGPRAVNLAALPSEGRGKVRLLAQEELPDDVLDHPWRILLPYKGQVALRALILSDEAVLLPLTEYPVRWLAHGDSITQGAQALAPNWTYVHLVANELGWDALNLGFGGSAWGDEAVAEYIASREDWDLLTLAIGTNTFGSGRESAADYARTYDRFLEIVRKAHPYAPIICITPIWRHEDGPPEIPNAWGDTVRAYRQAIQEVVQSRQSGDPHLWLIDGLSLIPNGRGLTIDQVHPDAHGMQRIAQGLLALLRSLDITPQTSPPWPPVKRS